MFLETYETGGADSQAFRDEAVHNREDDQSGICRIPAAIT